MVRQCHKDKAPGQTHLLSILLACRSTFRAGSGAAQLVLTGMNSMCTQSIEVHSRARLFPCSANRAHDSVKPLPSLSALADISYDRYQVNKNTWSETERSLATDADGICGLPKLRPTTSESVNVNVRCFAARGPLAPDRVGAHVAGVEYSQPLCLRSTCSSCGHPPTSSAVRMNAVTHALSGGGHCDHQRQGISEEAGKLI